MSDFELQSDDGLLSVKPLADALGISDETVYNWAARGMAHVKEGVNGEKLWDLAACRIWKEEHGPSQLKGGKRRGAGRKKKAEEAAASERVALTGLAAIFADKERELIAQGVPIEIAKGAGDVQALMDAVKDGRLRLSDIETMIAGLRAAAVLTDLKKKTGELVSMTEAESEFGQYLTYARVTLDNLPGRAAPEIAAAFQLPAESVPKVREILAGQVGIVKKQLQRQGTGH